jgi:hypothetical protein
MLSDACLPVYAANLEPHDTTSFVNRDRRARREVYPKAMRRLFLVVPLVAALVYACGSSGGDDSSPISGDSDGGSDVTISNNDDSGKSRDGATSSDSGSGDAGAAPLIIECGRQSDGGLALCDETNPYCCAIQAQLAGSATYFSCTPTQSSCTALDAGSTPILCRDTKDCAEGTVCCGQVEVDPLDRAKFEYASVSCQANCPIVIDAGESTFRRFCDPDASVNVCDGGTGLCEPSTILPTFDVCLY